MSRGEPSLDASIEAVVLSTGSRGIWLGTPCYAALTADPTTRVEVFNSTWVFGPVLC